MLGLWSVFLSKSTSYLSLCLSLIFLMQWDIKYLSIIKSWNQVWSLLGDHGLYPGLNPRHVGSSSYMSYKVSLLFLGSQIFFPVFLIHLFHVSFLTILHWMLNFFIFIFLTEKKNYFSLCVFLQAMLYPFHISLNIFCNLQGPYGPVTDPLPYILCFNSSLKYLYLMHKFWTVLQILKPTPKEEVNY